MFILQISKDGTSSYEPISARGVGQLNSLFFILVDEWDQFRYLYSDIGNLMTLGLDVRAFIKPGL